MRESATHTVGANYRAACRARSDADFISKIGVTLKEADESVYWLELIQEAGIKNNGQVIDAMKEGNGLVAIFVASSNTARNRVLRQQAQKKNQSAI